MTSAAGSVLRFDGFLRVYGADDEEEDRLPEIPKGARLPLATAEQLMKLAVEARNAKLDQARKKYSLEVAKIEARNERAGSRRRDRADSGICGDRRFRSK